MELEEYITELEGQNGYCECDEISGLLETRKEVVGLEKRCNFYENNISLEDPKPEDRDILEEYGEKVKEFNLRAKQYWEDLGDCLNKEDVFFRFHDKNCQGFAVRIPSEEAKRLYDDNEEPILTIHCGKCEQQIDFTDSLE